MIVLKTGLVPSAAGSAYFELELPNASRSVLPLNSTIKLICVVHGPKPLPRTASYSPNLQLIATVKYAPFASRSRRGYIRDPGERDLSSHLETALRGAIIPDRWPKSAIELSVTIIEGEDDQWWGSETESFRGLGAMNVLAGCITVASAALADARIDCLDLLTGGVAAIVRQMDGDLLMVSDPNPSEHENIVSACVVAYLSNRDELTETWVKGDLSLSSSKASFAMEDLINAAVRAARSGYAVLQEVIKESAEQSLLHSKKAAALVIAKEDATLNDVEMKL